MNKNYGSLLIDFLSGNNTLLIYDEEEFNDLYSLLSKVELEGILSGRSYEEWQMIARVNNCSVKPLVFEYQNSDGLTLYKNIEESREWFGMNPIFMNEISLKENYTVYYLNTGEKKIFTNYSSWIEAVIKHYTIHQMNLIGEVDEKEKKEIYENSKKDVCYSINIENLFFVKKGEK